MDNATTKHKIIARILGYSIAKHGTLGDEAPLLILINGQWVNTGFYDLPSDEEVLDLTINPNQEATT